jgi:hypothetical protein
MRESVWAIQLAMILVVENEAFPVAELRRRASDVDENVQHCPPRAPHELAHSGLEMHAADDPTARPGLVVLNELGIDAELGEPRPTVRLDEEPAAVAKHRWLEQDRTTQLGGQYLHAA